MIATFLLLATIAGHPGPRPISDAERAATAIVSRYLAGGPDVVWNELAPASPLRQLPKADALREIEVRFGPRAKSHWALQTAVPSLKDRIAIFTLEFPSGIDDTVAIEMEQDAALAWKIKAIRTAGEPVKLAAHLPKRADVRTPAAAQAPRDRRLPLSLMLPAAMLAILGAAARARWIVGIAAAIGLAAGLLLVVPASSMRAAQQAAPRVEEVPDLVRLAPLMPLRNALATGTPQQLGAHVDGFAREVALCWGAALYLRHEKFDDARRALDSLPRHAGYPMAEVLRARLAYLETKEIEAVAAYERAIELGPGRDGLWLEAAEVLEVLGFGERSEKYFDRTAAIGTREPDVYYTLATIAGFKAHDQDASRLFLAAWNMRPAERARVVSTAVLWRVIRRPEVAKALALHNVSEASFAPPADRPLERTEGVTAEVSGQHLRLRAGDGDLDVPGGAGLAPVGSPILDAGAWRRRSEETALLEFEEVRSRATSPAAFADPTYRDQILNTTLALATRNRWNDVLDLTEKFPPTDERVPLELMVMRGSALTRLERKDDLRTLVVGLLKNPSFQRKKEPSAMRLIAELLASIDDHDPAIRLLEHANDQMEMPGIEQRVYQLNVEKRLAGGYRVHNSAHFEVHYPEDTDPAGIVTLTEIMEKELKRLRAAWFPGLEMPKTIVNVLWWDEFAMYSGSLYIAGLYTNKIFLPLAGLDTFQPEVVAIMSHELTHAMLAEATNNLAPRWFHEAFASRIEMKEAAENGFQKYKDDRYLTVALLDAVANGSPDPSLIMESYSLGESTVRFIEAKYGAKALIAMIAAFREGATTDEAVHRATGLTVGELDANARGWGAKQKALFEGGKLIRYDGGKEKRF